MTILLDRSAKDLLEDEIAFRRALARISDGDARDDVGARTCTHCGEHVVFRVDPLGGWAECTHCGHLN